MWPDYQDIRSRLGDPLWWDEHGVPRYEPFHPKLCDIYARFAALIEVSCQNCCRRFPVGVSQPEFRLFPTVRQVEPPTQESIGWFHYGDPPRHECPGDTMNVDSLRILEFWRRGEETGWEWVRDPAFEFVMDDVPE